VTSWAGARDRGSAPVEFVLVGVLVTLMFLGLLQLGLDYYVRNVLAACVADGARYGANADVASPTAGAAEANREIAAALDTSYAVAFAPVHQVGVDGAPMVTVDVRARLPLLVWFLPIGPMVSASGHALMEPQR
jgi:Flp pilus assembly protein TadG